MKLDNTSAGHFYIAADAADADTYHVYPSLTNRLPDTMHLFPLLRLRLRHR